MESFVDLSMFRLDNVETVNPRIKSATLYGHIEGRDGVAILLLEKVSWSTTLEALSATLSTSTNLLDPVINNQFGQFSALLRDNLFENRANVKLIYPATKEDQLKYRASYQVLLRESKVDYETVTAYIKSIPSERTKWLRDILEGKAEQESVLVAHKDFVLIRDWKWDNKTISSLHVLAIVRDESLKSLRDLNATHLDLLRTIKKIGSEYVIDKYKIDAKELRIVVHYQPSYYLFHVHFEHLKQAEDSNTLGKEIFLDDVIQNIELIPNYYQTASIPLLLPSHHPLAAQIIEYQTKDAK